MLKMLQHVQIQTYTLLGTPLTVYNLHWGHKIVLNTFMGNLASPDPQKSILQAMIQKRIPIQDSM